MSAPAMTPELRAFPLSGRCASKTACATESPEEFLQ